MTKPELRQHFRRLRAALPARDRAARSRALAERLFAAPRIAAARTVLAYEAVGSEVETRFLLAHLWHLGRAVALPRVRLDGTMEMRLVRGHGELEPGSHGILQPNTTVSPPWVPDASDVVLVPGLAFTADGLRLGQGGGYYDRFLAAHPDLWTIGLAFTEQMAESLPCETHDVRLREVVVG